MKKLLILPVVAALAFTACADDDDDDNGPDVTEAPAEEIEDTSTTLEP